MFEIENHYCFQTRNNPDEKEVNQGFELLAICLFFFSPVGPFQNLIREWLNQNKDTKIPQKLINGKLYYADRAVGDVAQW